METTNVLVILHFLSYINTLNLILIVFPRLSVVDYVVAFVLLPENVKGVINTVIIMTVKSYKDCRLDWLHQWVLVKLAENGERLFTVSDLNREWTKYDFVTKSKLYRVCARLREAELVHTHIDSNDHIEDAKSYQLNSDGRYYVKEMDSKLSRPPEMELKKKIEKQEERISELERKMEAQGKFNVKNKEWMREVNEFMENN